MRHLAILLLVPLAACSTGSNDSACREAVGHADRALEIAADAFNAIAQGIDAISVGNYSAANRHLDDLDRLAADSRYWNARYQQAAEGCRA